MRRGGWFRVWSGVVVALAVGGCGASPANDSASTPRPSASPTFADGGELASKVWVVRLDVSAGEDGETTDTEYLRLTPATGENWRTTMPPVGVANVDGWDLPVLVDAGGLFALRDTKVSRADRDAHRITVTNLFDGGLTEVSTGSIGAAWVAFDARTPGLLRVVAGDQVWRIQLRADTTFGKPKAEGRLPQSDQFIFLGGFDRNTGKPFLEDIASNRTIPKGMRAPYRPVQRSGGTLLISDTDRLRGLPAADCDLVSGFRAGSGASYSLCQRGSRLTPMILAGDSWQPIGPDVSVPRGDQIKFAFPAG